MASFTFYLVVWTLIFGSAINVVTCAIELDFRVTPAVIQPLETKKVTLQCLVNERIQYYNNQQSYYYNNKGQYVPNTNPPPTGSEKSSIAMIRILKNLQSSWQAIAQISNIAPTVVHTLDGSVSSSDGVISDDLKRRSFIQVTWDVATSDAFGTYRCDVINFDSQQTAVLTKSSQISLGSSLNALDFLRLLKHDMTDIRGRIHQQEQGQRSDRNQTQQLKSELQKLETQSASKQRELEEKISEQAKLFHAQIEKLKIRTDDIESEITNKVDEVGSKVNISLDSGFLMLWPRGSFGLLQTEGGCSLGGMTSWESGWVRHHTESTDRNKDEVSNDTHLQQPDLERDGGNNFLTQYFCIKSDSISLGPNWPKGSYCINKKGKCPDMFDEGYIIWDEENINNLKTSVGSLPDGTLNDTRTTTIEYCCRQDGPADVPIYLPNSDPFYLYRYGGKCQQVHGMNRTEEFVLFDTENTNNNDAFGKVHPDGTIKNIRLELCYYRRI